MPNKTTYSDSGVNIDLGDQASKIFYEASKKSWDNRKDLLGEIIVPFDDFSGVRAIDVSSLPKGTLMGIGYDGVGTKVEIAERMQKFDTIGYDLLAMVCDDAIVRGAEPILAGSILDVNTLGTDENSNIGIIKDLAKGYLEAANAANVALMNGELAELGNSVSGYGDFNFSWGSSIVWFAHKDKMFKGDEPKLGDKIVSIRESGFRSNGLSLVRKIMRDSYGDNWHNEKFESTTLGEEVLTPSIIYSKAVCEMFGGIFDSPLARLHGVAHITGGGIPGKLGRILKASGLGAKLDNLIAPSDIMKHVQKLGNVEDHEAYRTWCMGQGLMIVTPEPEMVIKIAERHNMEAVVSGEVTDTGYIELESKGQFNEGVLKF